MQKAKARHSLLVVAAAAVLMTLPASASVTFDDPPKTEVTVVVRNFNTLDIEIVAVTESGKRFEVGTVTRGAKRTLALPNRLMASDQPFRLKIYSVASAVPPSIIDNRVAGVRTKLLSPADGEEILLNVRSPLIDSHLDRGAANSPSH